MILSKTANAAASAFTTATELGTEIDARARNIAAETTRIDDAVSTTSTASFRRSDASTDKPQAFIPGMSRQLDESIQSLKIEVTTARGLLLVL